MIHGYPWDQHNDNFTLNTFKLTFASPPAEFSGDKWDAGYRVSSCWPDAPSCQHGLGMTGSDVLREADVDPNVPIGTGLNVKVGELISAA